MISEERWQRDNGTHEAMVKPMTEFLFLSAVICLVWLWLV